MIILPPRVFANPATFFAISLLKEKDCKMAIENLTHAGIERDVIKVFMLYNYEDFIIFHDLHCRKNNLIIFLK